MEKNLTEKDLADYGFTEKNISRLKEVLSRPENKDETFSSLIEDLSKRFYGGIICLLLTFAPFTFLPFMYPIKLTFLYIPLAIFGVIAAYYIIPLNLSWKAYKFKKGSK